MTRLTRRSALGAGAAALVAAPTVARAQSTTRLKVQTAVPSSSIYFELMKHFGERIDKMSNGRLKLEILPDGAVVNAFEILDAVDKGVIDCGYAWTHYWSGPIGCT
jgi:TRAP-type mannitol/chloroaromatic compound transport system substrate-binding protein